MTLFGWLFGTNPQAPEEQIDEAQLLKLGVVGLLLYGGYRVIHKLTEAKRED